MRFVPPPGNRAHFCGVRVHTRSCLSGHTLRSFSFSRLSLASEEHTGMLLYYCLCVLIRQRIIPISEISTLKKGLSAVNDEYSNFRCV